MYNWKLRRFFDTERGFTMYVRAIRGATTVQNDTPNEVLSETKRLLEIMAEENQIHHDDIISILFTTTEDIKSVFPAAAARELGWTDVALMCAAEINIVDGLKKCIRVMMHINTPKTNTEINYVYLNEAKRLRPDLN